MPSDTGAPPQSSSSLDDLIGGKELLKLVVGRLSSQLLLFSVAVIVFVLAAFFLFEQQGLQVALVIVFVFIVGALGYLFAEEKRKLKMEEPEAVNRALSAQMASIVKPAGASATQPFRINLRVERVSKPGSRDIAVVAAGGASSGGALHVGDRVDIVFSVSRDAYLTLLNIGTSGKLTVLFPNAVHPVNRMTAGRDHVIPGSEYGFEYELQGPPGTERLKAVATLEPVQLLESSFAPDGSLFLQESPTAAARDIAVVRQKTQQLPPEAWTEAHVDFDVLP